MDALCGETHNIQWSGDAVALLVGRPVVQLVSGGGNL